MENAAFVLFDLDDTLYPAGAGLMREISARITRYVAEHLRISLDAADALRRGYYLCYGSAVHALGWKTIWVNATGARANARTDFVVRDLWQVASAFHQLGIMDAAHRVMAEHRLAGCAWAQVVPKSEQSNAV